MSDDWRDDPELFNKATGREYAASGFEAPTEDEAWHELGIISRLLENHGCATTRDLIAAASVAVDVSHKDAHSFTPEDLQNDMVEFAKSIFDPMQASITAKILAEPEWEKRAKFYARMTSIFLQLARLMGKGSLDLLKEHRDEIRARTEGTVADRMSTINEPVPDPASSVQLSPEDAVKKLLDMPVRSKHKH